MTKFNKKTAAETVLNYEGSPAYKQTAELEFVSIVLTSFVEDKFYEKASDTLTRLKTLIANMKDKKFAAKAAIYARNTFGMRSITHVVAGELANQVKGEKWTKEFYNKVVHRPDDITEIVSYYITNNKDKPIPNSLKKGLAKAFAKFDAYQLAKYRGEGNKVKLVDVVNLVHPKPTKDNKQALKQLVEGKLKSKDTWETKLTQAGQKAETDEEKEELKAEAWAKLLKEDKLGYFAALRNCRNIIEQAPDQVTKLCKVLRDKDAIKKSLVLPFRYSTAIDAVKNISGKEAREVMQAIEDAFEIAVSNVPKFDGDTCVVLDCSASMEGKPAQIGDAFAAILAKSNNADIVLFSDDANYHNYKKNSSTLDIAKSIHHASGGTNFKAIFTTLNKKYDRIIILSDMQGWIGYDTPKKEFNQYRKDYKATPSIYSFDLNGYGTMQFPEDKVYCIAGFSEKIFDVMKLLEKDKNALITEINKVEV